MAKASGTIKPRIKNADVTAIAAEKPKYFTDSISEILFAKKAILLDKNARIIAVIIPDIPKI